MEITLRLQKLMRLALGRDIRIRPNVTCRMELFGGRYAGWYVATDGLDNSSVVYSLGVGTDVSFDTALITKYGLTVHAFDPTIKAIEWVKAQDLPPSFVMHEYGVAGFDGTALFSPPENPDFVSETLLDRPTTRDRAVPAPVKRLGTIMAELGHDRIDVLKMNIEGAEYDIIADMSTTDIRPRQILVDFHHRFPGVGIARTKEAMGTLRSMGYGVFAVPAATDQYGFVRVTH